MNDSISNVPPNQEVRQIKEGLTAPKLSNGSGWKSLDDERTQVVISMRKRRATLTSIGVALGVSREYARMLTVKIIKEHGAQILEPEQKLWTTQEARKELGISQHLFQYTLELLKVSFWNEDTGSPSLIDEAAMEKFRQYFSSEGERRICTICGTEFLYNRRKPGEARVRKKYNMCFAPECIKEVERRQRAALLQKGPSFDSLTGWRKELWKILQTHALPEDENWILIGEAALRSNISRQTIYWLQLRHVFSMRPDPRKKGRSGNPIKFYAASEIEIARQVKERSEIQMTHQDQRSHSDQHDPTLATLPVEETRRHTKKESVPSKRITRPSVADLRNARAQGLTIKQMRDKWGGVAQSTISRWIKNAGLTRDDIPKTSQQSKPAQQIPNDIKSAIAGIGEQRIALIVDVARIEAMLTEARERLAQYDQEVLGELRNLGIPIPTTTE